MRKVKVIDAEVRRNIDLEFLDKAKRWMEDSKKKNGGYGYARDFSVEQLWRDTGSI